jgi:uncharacterized membrane-anchored protein YitT (DUF2179 family)
MTGEKRKKALKKMLNFILMTVGSVIYAASISLFLDPNALAPGGVAGISIILHQVTNVDTGIWIMLLNIPILALGTWKFGFKFILSTIYCTALSSFVTNALTPMGAVTEDLFLAALAGSSLMALGMGLVFKAGATTGGMDIVVKVLRIRMPHMRTGSLVLILDALVVIASAFVFKDVDRAMYAGVAIFITSVVLDLVLYGRDGAKLVYIISDEDERIANRLLEELNLGVTYMNGSGAYSGREKKVIMCVMHKNLSPKAEEIVKEEDPLAFMIITNATEIYGEGYKSIFSEKL